MPELDKSPQRVGRMFASIAPRYDRANHVLSLNRDRRWRRRLVAWAAPQAGEGVLDVCAGTGDLSLALAAAADIRVVGLDISPQMLDLARQKARRAGLAAHVRFQMGNALELPYPPAAFDLVTVAFGLRNLPDYDAGLREMHRVLRPGGRLMVLEFSQPDGLWGALYLWYLRRVLPPLGGWLSGSRQPYRYLHDSIRGFPGGRALGERLTRLGFEPVDFRPCDGGVACIHRALKPPPPPGSDT